MNSTLKKMLVTVGAPIAKKLLMTQAIWFVSHGVITESYATVYVSLGMALIGVLWEFWNDYGSVVLKAQMQIYKAKVLAQAAKLNDAGLKPVTVSQIAAQSPTLTPEAVAKAITKMPPEIQAAVAPVKAVMTMAIVAVAMSLFAFGSPASATPTPKARPAAASTDPLQKLMDDITNKDAKIIAGTIAALQEADTDAASLTNPTDPTSLNDAISHACYPAQIRFLQSLPQVKPIAAPAPYKVIVVFQRKRDLIATIKKGLPDYLKLGCAALVGDEAQILAQTLGLAGVTVAAGTLTGLFPAAAPLTLPALSLPLGL